MIPITVFGPHGVLLPLSQIRIIENDIFKQDWRARTRGQIFQYVALKWTLACLVGVFTGITGIAINFTVENIAGFKLLQATNFIQNDRFFFSSTSFPFL
jgi:chloride channel 7